MTPLHGDWKWEKIENAATVASVPPLATLQQQLPVARQNSPTPTLLVGGLAKQKNDVFKEDDLAEDEDVFEDSEIGHLTKRMKLTLDANDEVWKLERRRFYMSNHRIAYTIG